MPKNIPTEEAERFMRLVLDEEDLAGSGEGVYNMIKLAHILSLAQVGMSPFRSLFLLIQSFG